MVSSHPRSRLILLAVAAGILFGIALRIYVLAHHTGGFDSDEAVTGLMARRFLSHPLDHQAFYWGTNYGGTLQAMVAAVPFALFGSSVLALKLTEVLWHAAAAVLVWRIGRRLIDERAGVVAALILWIWPALTVHWSTKARGFYGATEALGLVLLLYALRLADRPDRRVDWFVAGAAAGLGWWTNPQIVFFALPAGLWLVVRNRRALLVAVRTRALAWAAPGALAGALPWLYWNAGHHWSSLGGNANPGINRAEGFLGHFERVWREGLPVALGLRAPYEYNWAITPAAVAKTLFLAGLGFVAVTLLRRGRGALLLAIALAAYPILHSLGPVAGVTSEGRYFFYLMPLLALALARAVRTPWAIALLFSVLIVSTVTGLRTIPPGNAGIVGGKLVPKSMGPLISSLKAEHVGAVFSDYWIAYRLTFESRERVIGSAVDGERYRPYGEMARRNPAPGWVFLEETLAEVQFRGYLERRGIPFRTWRKGGFAVYVPALATFPEQVPPAGAGG